MFGIPLRGLSRSDCELPKPQISAHVTLPTYFRGSPNLILEAFQLRELSLIRYFAKSDSLKTSSRKNNAYSRKANRSGDKTGSPRAY